MKENEEDRMMEDGIRTYRSTHRVLVYRWPEDREHLLGRADRALVEVDGERVRLTMDGYTKVIEPGARIAIRSDGSWWAQGPEPALPSYMDIDAMYEHEEGFVWRSSARIRAATWTGENLDAIREIVGPKATLWRSPRDGALFITDTPDGFDTHLEVGGAIALSLPDDDVLLPNMKEWELVE